MTVRDQLLEAMRNACTREEVLALQRRLMEIDLAKQRARFRSVQVCFGQAKTCSVCEGMRGALLASNTPADRILPDQCERVRAKPTMLCSIDVSYAIKDADGNVRFDRR
jgi:hypothetical protein